MHSRGQPSGPPHTSRALQHIGRPFSGFSTQSPDHTLGKNAVDLTDRLWQIRDFLENEDASVLAARGGGGGRGVTRLGLEAFGEAVDWDGLRGWQGR